MEENPTEIMMTVQIDDSSEKRWQNGLKFGTKVAITIAILTAIFVNVEYEELFAILRRSNAVLLVMVPLIAAPTIFLDSLRWTQVMKGLGEHLSLLTASRYILVGWFFANFFPGFIGFDGFRAIQMRRLNVPTELAIRSVVFDRLSAFVSLLVTILLLLPYTLSILPDGAFRTVAIGVAVFGTAACLFLFILGACRDWINQRTKRNLIQQIANQASDFLTIFGQPQISLSILASGFGVHLMRATIVFVIAIALSINVSIIDCVAIIPISLLIAMIPISFGDWGVREAVFVFSLGNIGFSLEEALATSICFGLYRLTVGAIGGLAWLAMKREHFALGKPT